ncbi:RNA-binding protein Nova-1 [Homalodisca vitripennis]|nr:RNA-binding protein Nova-1 [Homalodisca vitripennis]
MSKANDFYPGTSERVCLISGSVDAIISVLTFIMEKIKEKPEHVVKNEMENKTGTERDKQVKILVPNSTAGMIIGKGGNYIKQVKEESGSNSSLNFVFGLSHVSLQRVREKGVMEWEGKFTDIYFQKVTKLRVQNKDSKLSVLQSEMENNKKACMLILAKVMEDPQSGSCPNVSYADISGPVANYNPTGSPFAHPTGQNLQSTTFASTANLNSTVAGKFQVGFAALYSTNKDLLFDMDINLCLHLRFSSDS